MARRSGTYHRILHKHGLIWWMTIGWWWRPISWFVSASFAQDVNYRQMSTEVIDKPMFTLTVKNHTHGKLWWIFVGWWWRAIKYYFLFSFRLFFYFKLVFVKV